MTVFRASTDSIGEAIGLVCHTMAVEGWCKCQMRPGVVDKSLYALKFKVEFIKALADICDVENATIEFLVTDDQMSIMNDKGELVTYEFNWV